jgi:inosose dehydratase
MLPILRAADVTLCGGWFSGTLVNEDSRPTRTASRR